MENTKTENLPSVHKMERVMALGVFRMTNLAAKAEEYFDKTYGSTNNILDEEIAIRLSYVAGAIENGIVWHDLRENPQDLPTCEENKQILFYVKEWYESIQKFRCHYCLGFYKKSFLHDDVKLFVERSKGYESEHLPKMVFIWGELPEVEEC